VTLIYNKRQRRFTTNTLHSYTPSHGGGRPSRENPSARPSGHPAELYDACQRARTSPTGLAYESYVSLEGCVFQVHVGGGNPNASARYRELF